MEPSQVLNPSVSIYFGLASQTLAMLLLLTLFLLLRRYAGRRIYFHAWTWAWLALAAGLLALVLRIEILKVSDANGWLTRTCLFAYQLGKLTFLLFLLQGVLLYLRGQTPPQVRQLRWLWPIAVVFAVFSVLISANQPALM
ncbi:MAG: hypothetical protein ACRESC_02270, partial [Gammaproteobacteria bacterium]